MDGVLTTDVREREDLSDVVDTLMLNSDDMRMYSFVGYLGSIADVFGAGVTAEKHEWFDDIARPMTFLSGLSGAGLLWDSVDAVDALTINSAYTAKLRVGDMFVLGDGLEVVRIKSIDVSANTVSVSGRGHGATDGAAQGEAAFTMRYIGNAQDENSDPITANYQAPTEKYNYCQSFEDVASVSGTIRRSKTIAGDLLDQTIVKKLKELARGLNAAIVEGIKDKTGNIATMGGLREYCSTTSNVGGALTIANFYVALVAHVDAGFFPHAVHANAGVIAKIEQLFNTTVRTKSNEKKGGQSINVITAMGYDIELHVDRDMRSGEFLILDYNRAAYGPLDGGKYENGNFAAYPLWDKTHAKETAVQLFGQFTLHVANGAVTRAYGITS